MRKRAFLFVFLSVILLLTGGLSACQNNRTTSGKYKITFDTQGGSPISPLYLSSTDTLTFPEAPVKSGYEFDGWYLDPACTVVYNPYVFKINADVTFYARWVDVNLYPHSITVKDNGYKVLVYKTSEGMTTEQMAEKWDVLFNISHLSAPKDTRVQISAMVEKEGYQLKNGTLSYNSVVIEGNSFLMPAEDVVIDFELELKTYTVSVLSAANGFVFANTSSAVMGDRIDVTILPEPGYRLNRITCNLVEFTPPYFIMPAENIVLIATFEPISGPYYPVTTDYTGQGSVTADVNSARKGDYVEVTAEPAPGYFTYSLTVNGSPIENGYFVMPGSAASVTAVFVPINTSVRYPIRIDLQITGGSISASGTYASKGQTVVLSATPQTGYEFGYFTVNGVPISGNSFVMPEEDANVSACFFTAAKQISIQSTIGGSVSVIPRGGKAFPGDIITLEIHPDQGYVYKMNSLRLNGIPIDERYFVMPDDDVIISAEFLPEDTGDGTNPYTISVDEEIQHGCIRISKTAADAGDLIFLEVFADEGYRLKEGTLRINGMPYHTYYQMGEENATVTAEFERVYTIVYYDDVDGYVYPDRSLAAEGETVFVRYGAYGAYKADGARISCNGIDIADGSFVMPGEDVRLDADFASIGTEEYRINIAASTNGSIACSAGYAKPGIPVNLTVAPATGYRLKSIYYMNAADERTETGSVFLMPAQDISLHADFEPDGTYSAQMFYSNNKTLIWDNGGKLYYYSVHQSIKEFLQGYSLGAFACYVDEALFAELNKVVVVLKLNQRDQAPYLAYKLASGLKNDYPDDIFRCSLEGDLLLISSLPDLSEANALLKNGLIVDNGLIYYPCSDGGLCLLTANPSFSRATLDIPLYVEGRAVIKLAPGALRNVSGLKALSLGIVRQLSDKALQGATDLVRIDLSRVTMIGKEVFKDCLSLQKFSVASFNGKYYTYNNGTALYEKSGTQSYAVLLRYAPAAASVSFTLRSGSQKIASYAFFGAGNLHEIIFSATLTTLEDYALYGAPDLTYIDISSAIQEAGYHSLYWEGSQNLNIILRSGAKINASAGEILYRENYGGQLSIKIDLSNATDSARLALLNAYRSDSIWSDYADAFWFEPMTGFYLVYFYSNGGSYVNAVTVNQGVNVSVPYPAPVREGYVFEGWYTDDGTFLNKYDFMSGVTANLKLYAHWVPAS